ncbi:sarcosine oxidase subunit delta [Cribrihabitans neustonicus]|uniref:sarcosine oxidase subunit delta n=1 Tax=Cribrihabitans neustonicus TaxID=1429085 RepID=UPI003B599837
MRVCCPICGERDRREFSVKGAAVVRPAENAGLEAWHRYLHLRGNPAGRLDELWYHEMGCGTWLVVTRDTVSHAVLGVQLAADAGLGGAA